MNEKDKHDSKEQTKHSKSSRSVSDFSSVEDLRETDRDLVSTEKTQPKIPFNKSYIAHAPSRHLFTLNSRCTYLGGFGTSCKDIGGSAEDLTGYKGNDKRNLGLRKLSTSSPDLFGAGYQSSNSDDVTEEESCEDFVTHFDEETNLEKEGKHINESITEPKHEDDTKLRLETKWATKIETEDRFQLSMSKLLSGNRRQYTRFSSEAKNDSATSMFEGLGKTDKKKTLTQQYPGTNNAGVHLVSEISVSGNNDEDKIESFNKGWENILHSGKAELKKSLENLDSLRQDVNSREIYNDDSTFESKRFVSDESIELYESTGEEMILKHTSNETMEIKDFETGIKRNDEMAGLSIDSLSRNEKRQKISQENASEVFSQGGSSSCVLTTGDEDKQTNYSGMSHEEKYTTNKVNTDEATITPRDKTANRNVEKPTASSTIINSKNDTFDLRTSKEQHAAANDKCLSFNVELFQTKSNDKLDSKAAKLDGNYSSSLTQLLCSSTVEKMEGSVLQATDDRNESVDKTHNSEESSKRITLVPLCNISPIPLTVLSNSYHQNIPWQNTEEFRKDGTNHTVQVSEISQSSVSMTKDDKTTVDRDRSLLNSWLKNPNENPYAGSFDAPNKMKDNSSQTIEDEKQRTSFENDYNGLLFNSTHETNNNLLNNTANTEKAKSDDLPKESADNSLMKGMMGMFCFLGLKDSPEGGFYSNGQLQYKEEKKAKSEGNEQKYCVDETIMTPKETAVNIPKDISRSLSAFNQNQESLEEEELLNSMKPQSSVNTDFHECINAHKGAKSDSSTDSEKMKIQQIILLKGPQKERTLNEYISDVFTLEEKSIVDEDLLLNIEPDETLRLSDIETGKQEEAVKHGNTERYIDEGVLSPTAMTEDLLLSTPDEDDLQPKKEITVENYDSHFIASTADLTSKHSGLKLSSENKQEQKLKNMNTSNLEINRNKWSHALIIPHRTMNTSKSLSGVLNILVLDSELVPTSPERKHTVVTLNFYSGEGKEKYPQERKNEVSQVDIQMNGKKDIFIVDDSNPDLVQEPENEDSNSDEENILQNSLDDNIEIVIQQDNSENHPGQMDNTKLMPNELFTDDSVFETVSYPENTDGEVAITNEIQQLIFQTDVSITSKTSIEEFPEKNCPDFGEKERQETISNTGVHPKPFDNIELNYPSKLKSDDPTRQTVQKVDFKRMKDKRLSEHLRSFETDELVDEKMTKQKKTEQNNVFTELDEIFLLENEIQETITKDEMKGVQHEMLLKVDELFTPEDDTQDEETVVMKTFEENNNVVFLQEEVSLSESTQKVTQEPKHPQDLLQLLEEVPEVITKTVQDRSLQNNYLFQLDEVLQPKYVHEFVPNKLKAQHNKHDNLLEADKYFDSLKHTQQNITQRINNTQLEQSSEFPEQRTGPKSPTKNVEKSVAYISIPRQNNEDDIDQTNKERNDSGRKVAEENPQEAWEITFNNKMVHPAKEFASVSKKGARVSDTESDELILIISHPKNSIHDGDNDIDYADDARQYTPSPTSSDLSSALSDYDTSSESSWESSQNHTEHQSNREDCLTNHDVPGTVTTTNPNPDTVESEYKILRASYSTIQPQVYNVDSQTADIKVTVDGKNIDGETIIGKNIPLHTPKQCEVAEQLHTSKPTTVRHTENNFNTNTQVALTDGTLVDEGNQYRTTMDIHQNKNQVSTSYVLFQRFGEQDSPKTYFELNYDVDTWKVGETINTDRDDELDKTFAVSYATIEQVNHPQVASPVYLPTIEEDEIYDEAVYYVQATQMSNKSNKERIEYLQSSSPLPPPLSPPQTPPQSPTPPLLPPLSTPVTPPQSPTSPLPPPLSTPLTPPQSPTPPLLPPLSPPLKAPQPPTSPLLPPLSPSQTPQQLSPPPQPSSQLLASSPPQLPTTTKSHTLEEKKQETNFHNVHYTNEDFNQNTPYPLLQPVKTSYTKKIEEESQNLEEILETPQPPPETLREDVQLVEIDYNLQQEITPEIPCHVPSTSHAEDIEPHLPAPLEISQDGVPYEHLRTIEVPPLVSESRPPVWSFAQSVFHTDGQSKTFFKVIDNRNKSFQSSTFMYRGERIKVSRKVNVFKSSNENWKQDFDDGQEIEGRVYEDNKEYSEIWDDGNLMPGNVLNFFS